MKRWFGLSAVILSLGISTCLVLLALAAMLDSR